MAAPNSANDLARQYVEAQDAIAQLNAQIKTHKQQVKAVDPELKEAMTRENKHAVFAHNRQVQLQVKNQKQALNKDTAHQLITNALSSMTGGEDDPNTVASRLTDEMYDNRPREEVSVLKLYKKKPGRSNQRGSKRKASGDTDATSGGNAEPFDADGGGANDDSVMASQPSSSADTS